jgi:uncharacterized protein (TIGR02596 family)
MPDPREHQDRGVSLLELLAVVAVIGVLAMLGTSALSGLGGTYDLASAGQAVVDELGLARQIAITENRVVEFQIFKLKTGSLDSEEFCAMALVKSEPKADGSGTSKEFVRRVSYLPARTIFDPRTKFSSLLDGQSNTNASLPLETATPGDASVPAGIRGVPSVSFRFRPDGSADLASTDTLGARRHWTLTLRGYRPSPPADALPPNFIAISLDPLTGKAVHFQP